jgi:thioredoxin reductase (NADPH)
MLVENIVIIGSGPAALTAAMYAARFQLQPLVIQGSAPGGLLMGTSLVENWPGTRSILGPDLMLNMHNHAQDFGTKFLAQEALSLTTHEHPFTITTNKDKTIKTRSIIIATGVTPKRLHCSGEDLFWGKGVSTCAVCDGALYRNKRVIIIGGGDTAMEDASFMTNFTNDITIIHILDKLTATPIMQERVLNHPSIKIIYNSTVTAFRGSETHVTEAVITHLPTNTQQILGIDAAFVAIGLKPNSSLVKDTLELNDNGYIIHKNHTETSVKGIFAAGDVVDYRYRQAVTAAANGCMAALDAERYLKETR